MHCPQHTLGLVPDFTACGIHLGQSQAALSMVLVGSKLWSALPTAFAWAGSHTLSPMVLAEANPGLCCSQCSTRQGPRLCCPWLLLSLVPGCAAHGAYFGWHPRSAQEGAALAGSCMRAGQGPWAWYGLWTQTYTTHLAQMILIPLV